MNVRIYPDNENDLLCDEASSRSILEALNSMGVEFSINSSWEHERSYYITFVNRGHRTIDHVSTRGEGLWQAFCSALEKAILEFDLKDKIEVIE